MTARVERRFSFDVPPETLWPYVADPAFRAAAISVVDGYEVHDDGARWDVSLPLTSRTFAVETTDEERDPPRYVRFVGRSRAFRVVGEHELEATDDGCVLTVRFVVEGRLPGVERFFERNLDRELENLERALRAELPSG